jgi:hypothetical protein
LQRDGRLQDALELAAVEENGITGDFRFPMS